MVRSRATPEEECHGKTSLSQGGYYQYDQGFQGAFRDPLQHMLPMLYAHPALARSVIELSAQQQLVGIGAIPYALQQLCTPYYLGGFSGDLDFWLLWGAAEYVLATRDLSFLDKRLPFQLDLGGTASVWDHLKLAYFHMENLVGKGPHGMPTAGTFGDWADFSTVTMLMTESTLETVQLVYGYRRLADVADLKGDRAFAARLRASADRYARIAKREWTGGWYSRGYSGLFQIGADEIMAEPQPWALIAGLADASQARTLVDNFRRYLTGVGMPGGPSKVGSALRPPPTGITGVIARQKALADGVAAWWAINEPMVWAYAVSDELVPNAELHAWDEFLRQTLANLATVHPDHWDGIISVDDVCNTWWTPPPYTCGVLNPGEWYTQVLHQPAWELYAMTKLAGIEPTRDGYRFAPRVPLERFAFTLPNVGIQAGPGFMRGYLRPLASGPIRLEVRLPAGARLGSARVGGGDASAVQVGRRVTLTAAARAGELLQWEVTW
jgi:hypothetical protein